MPTGKLSKEEFYSKYYPIVKDSVEGTGLFPETVIAQMAIETGWGASAPNNNFFGLKSHGKSGGEDLGTTEEVNGVKKSTTSNFRTYNSVEDSIKDYVNFVKSNSRYEKAGVFNAKTPQEQAKAFGKSGYATGSNYGNEITSTINANKDKTNTMETNSSNPIIDKQIRKVQALKAVDGESEEYKKESEKLTSLLRNHISTTQKAKEADYTKRLSEAKKNEDWDAYEKLGTEYNAFTKSKVDPYKVTDKMTYSSINNVTTDKEGKIHGYGSRVVGNKNKVVDSDLDGLLKLYQTENPTENKLPEQPVYKNDTVVSTDGTGTGTTTEKAQVIDDRGKPKETADPLKTDLAPKEDLDALIKQKRQELDDLASIKPQNFNAEGDYQNDSDILGSVLDIGQSVMGMIGANKDVPEYKRGSMFQTAMDEATAKRNQGLSAEELAVRERDAEKTYAYDVKNINRAAGGNAGAYLGNVSGAAARLYGNKSQTAAQDEAVRRLNNQNFQQMSLQDEQVNRQIFGDEYNQTMMTKEAGAGLVRDSIMNIKERADYNKQYGKDSYYGRYMDSIIANTKSSTASRLSADQNRYKSMFSQSQKELDDLIAKRNDALPTITGMEPKTTPLSTTPVLRTPSTVTDYGVGSPNYTDPKDNIPLSEEEKMALQDEATRLANEKADAFLNGSERKSLFKKRKK